MNAALQQPQRISDYAPGIYPDIPAEVYHQRELGVVNNGALKILANRTPAHYRAWVDAEDKEAPALAFGRAIHCALLEPDEFERTYIQAREHPYRRPSQRQRDAKNPSAETLAAIDYWDAWQAECGDKIEITHEEGIQLRAMQAALQRHSRANALLRGGMKEATAIWNEPDHGLLCKARMDVYDADRGLVIDLKTAECAAEFDAQRSFARYGYHIQHAHYACAMQALGRGVRAFVFVVIEKEPPHAIAVYSLDAEAEARGMELRNRAISTLNCCLEADQWPGYPEAIQRLSLPGWALND